MSRYALAILVVLAFAATAAFVGASQPIPAFEQYRVKPRQIETPAQPVLKKEFQENTVWRDAIIEAAKAPANFTGQYSMISLPGAGTGVEYYVVLDLVSGTVALGPGDAGVISYSMEPLKFEGGEMGVQFKPDSRLLAMRGCLKQGCGAFYYEWSATQWNLLRESLAAKANP